MAYIADSISANYPEPCFGKKLNQSSSAIDLKASKLCKSHERPALYESKSLNIQSSSENDLETNVQSLKGDAPTLLTVQSSSGNDLKTNVQSSNKQMLDQRVNSVNVNNSGHSDKASTKIKFDSACSRNMSGVQHRLNNSKQPTNPIFVQGFKAQLIQSV